jgi:metal-responsive CopG/Arc/MetJ family transcriptional regulator
MAVEKVTFTLPEELVRRLGRVPAGMRSKFVKEAVERELRRQSAAAELKKLRGKLIWKEKHHPELRGSKDFARYRPAKSRITDKNLIAFPS